MGRRNRKSKRRVKSLLMLLTLTAIMMIVSTYAWFSANREVSITGITATVSAAEGLQISLDAATWGSSVTVNQTALTTLGTAVNNFQWPDELVPVSTGGQIDGNDVQFFFGDISADGTTLTNCADVTVDGTKYIAFDVYFKNSSSRATDNLQLNTGSTVAIGAANGVSGTGLEYSTRVGVLLYDNHKAMSETAANCRSMAAGTTPLASIWEPNATRHIAEVVANDGRISADPQAFTTLGLISAGSGTLTPVNVSTVGTSTFLQAQTTMQTAGALTAAQNMTAVDGTTELTLVGNSIMKARVYIWLEGQDPDCNDTASTGKEIDVVINFTKPAVTTGSGSGSGGSGSGGSGSGG